MTVELRLTSIFFAHLSRILMLASMIGCPPWQMVSVSAASALGAENAAKLRAAAQKPKRAAIAMDGRFFMRSSPGGASTPRTGVQTRASILSGRRPGNHRAQGGPTVARRTGDELAARSRVAVDRLHDQALGFRRRHPAHQPHPFVRLQILVVLEEVRDLLAQ